MTDLTIKDIKASWRLVYLRLEFALDSSLVKNCRVQNGHTCLAFAFSINIYDDYVLFNIFFQISRTKRQV